MAFSTKQVNITLAQSEDVVALTQIKIVDLRNKIIELFDKQPIISQFPDVVAIVEPVNQLSTVVQSKKVIISNQEVKDFNGRDIEKLMQFANFFREVINKPLIGYGFNYTFILDIEAGTEDAIKGKNTSLINIDSLGIAATDLISSGVNISYIEGGKRFQIISTPLFEEKIQKMIALSVQTNVHFSQDALPGFTELVSSFKQCHDSIKSKVDNIFNI